jgi:hypothetical protein
MRHELPKPDLARNMRLIGHSDQGRRPDGVQIMVANGHAFIGHMFSKGFSVVDVRDPRRPHAVKYIPAPPNTWNIHLQSHEHLLLVVNAKDMFAAAGFADERAYYRGQIGQIVGTAGLKDETGRSKRDWIEADFEHDRNGRGRRFCRKTPPEWWSPRSGLPGAEPDWPPKLAIARCDSRRSGIRLRRSDLRQSRSLSGLDEPRP